MWILYQAAMAAALAIAAPVLLARRRAHYGATLRGRLGMDTDGPRPDQAPPGGRLWIHAVSVGEVAVAATLTRALPADLPLVVTTVTPTGQARARAAFAGRNAQVAYLPFDLSFAIARFVRRYRPHALILVEGDYWPLVLRRARQLQLPVAVVNGRVGARSFARWRQLRRFLPAVFRATGLPAIDTFGVQTEDDAARLRALGVAPERVRVTGNLKFDSVRPASNPALERAVLALAGGRPVLIAGSTMQGEDEPVLDAFARLDDGGVRRALLVLVPRHPERWDTAVTLAENRGLRCLRRSALDLGHVEPGAGDTVDVLVLDSMGELAALYAIATAAFIGGTLVPTGGHNPLEPAGFAVPIVVGPSMFNFKEMATLFDDAGAWERVADADGLARCWDRWLRRPAVARAVGRRAEALLVANQGALDQTQDMLRPVLARATGAAKGSEP